MLPLLSVNASHTDDERNKNRGEFQKWKFDSITLDIYLKANDDWELVSFA
jgi:hypothetical protein